VEVVASLSQGRTAAAQCGLFTYKSVLVIFEPPCRNSSSSTELRLVLAHRHIRLHAIAAAISVLVPQVINSNPTGTIVIRHVLPYTFDCRKLSGS